MPHRESDQVWGSRENHVRRALWLLWQAIRWPILMLLIMLEPLIRTALCGFALLGILTAIMIRCAADRPHFPFWGTLGLSMFSVGILLLYYASIRLLSRQ